MMFMLERYILFLSKVNMKSYNIPRDTYDYIYKLVLRELEFV